MKVIDPSTVTDIDDARKLLTDLQIRLLKAENCLDDLARSVEIAQCTRQYQLTEVFIREATDLLQDRLVIPVPDSNGPKITMVEASEEGIKAGLDILNQDPTIDKIKHDSITGIVHTDHEIKNEIKQ